MKLSQLLFLIFVSLLSGCSSFGPMMKRLVGGKPAEQIAGETEAVMPPRFSENPNLYTPVERQFRRMTRERLEEENEVHARAGSLWSMEGQKSYLFSQNTSRREGDHVKVSIVGAAESQIATKVEVIKSLLARIEESRDRMLASVDENTEAAATSDAPNGDAGSTTAESSAQEEDSLAVSEVPAQIVQILADGNYRIKGSQPFMIGENQYKVIVTGIIKAEDFNDEGVKTDKLLEPQYDVVSLRRVKR